jgi:hypothetical protein
MLYRTSIGAVALVAAMISAMCGGVRRTKYPDWSGQWTRPRGLAIMGPGQAGRPQAQAPLTPEYQARLVASIADRPAANFLNRYSA